VLTYIFLLFSFLLSYPSKNECVASDKSVGKFIDSFHNIQIDLPFVSCTVYNMMHFMFKSLLFMIIGTYRIVT